MSRSLRLFNTRTHKVEDFVPMRQGQVGMYTCGPTVYSYAHIGNLRSYVFADSLRRMLEYFGNDVNHVMNITDVGHLTDDADSGFDKLEVGAKREGLDAWAVAHKYTEAFFDHAAKLNILRPKVICKATDYIPEQIALVEKLEQEGFVYETSDGMYFDTARYKSYGDFARLDIAGLQEGIRVDSGEKKQKTDFALWKFSKPEDKRAMEWDSPWGRGFPGWHIECSAMSMKFLGEQFDIHTGGVDHIPIHHTNEIAQSECATGKSPFVNYWLHGEFLVVEQSEKMSKSVGNILTVSTLEEKGFDPLAYRLLCLQSHYRKQLKFNFDILAGAARSYSRLRASLTKLIAENQAETSLTKVGLNYLEQFEQALANDLNMPQALATLFTMLDDASISDAEKVALVHKFEPALALDLDQPYEPKAENVPIELVEYLNKRNEARKEKRWPEADKYRDLIIQAGYEILDSPEGSSLRRRL